MTKRKSNVQDVCGPWLWPTPLQKMAEKFYLHRKASEFIGGNHILRSHVIYSRKAMLIQITESVYPLFWTPGHINEVQSVQWFKMEKQRSLQNAPQVEDDTAQLQKAWIPVNVQGICPAQSIIRLLEIDLWNGRWWWV